MADYVLMPCSRYLPLRTSITLSFTLPRNPPFYKGGWYQRISNPTYFLKEGGTTTNQYPVSFEHLVCLTRGLTGTSCPKPAHRLLPLHDE
jgi:hypothetical protein